MSHMGDAPEDRGVSAILKGYCLRSICWGQNPSRKRLIEINCQKIGSKGVSYKVREYTSSLGSGL